MNSQISTLTENNVNGGDGQIKWLTRRKTRRKRKCFACDEIDCYNSNDATQVQHQLPLSNKLTLSTRRPRRTSFCKAYAMSRLVNLRHIYFTLFFIIFVIIFGNLDRKFAISFPMIMEGAAAFAATPFDANYISTIYAAGVQMRDSIKTNLTTVRSESLSSQPQIVNKNVRNKKNHLEWPIKGLQINLTTYDHDDNGGDGDNGDVGGLGGGGCGDAYNSSLTKTSSDHSDVFLPCRPLMKTMTKMIEKVKQLPRESPQQKLPPLFVFSANGLSSSSSSSLSSLYSSSSFNRTYSVQLININQSDAVKSVRAHNDFSHLMADGLRTDANRVNLTNDNTSSQLLATSPSPPTTITTTKTAATTTIANTGSGNIILDDISFRDGTVNGNVSKEANEKKAPRSYSDSFATFLSQAAHSFSQVNQRTGDERQRPHSDANSSSIVDARSISAISDSSGSSGATINLATAVTAKAHITRNNGTTTTTTTTTTMSNLTMVPFNASNATVDFANDVSNQACKNKVTESFQRKTRPPTKQRDGKDSDTSSLSSSSSSSSSIKETTDDDDGGRRRMSKHVISEADNVITSSVASLAPVSDVHSSPSSSSSSFSFNHILRDVLIVSASSAVIDSSPVMRPALREVSQFVTGPRSIAHKSPSPNQPPPRLLPPITSSSSDSRNISNNNNNNNSNNSNNLDMNDPLGSNYYRYRDQDPNVLLSRYPSLRRPPPPPEFADDFEGITELGAVAGDRVDIPCNASNWSDDEVSLVLWFRGDTGVPMYRVDARSSPLEAASHTIAPELRQRLHFDFGVKPPVLRINPVLPSDAAEYRCRVDFRQARTQNLLVALNVTVPPKELLIMDVEGQKLEGLIGPYDENSNVLLICEAEGGKPSPSVHWFSGSRLLDSSYTTGPHGLVRNELNFRNLNRSDFMSILTCRASNNNVTEPISSTVILDMNLRPLEVRILTKSATAATSAAAAAAKTSAQSSSYSSKHPSMNGSSGQSSVAKSSTVSPSVASNAIVLSASNKAEFQCRTIGSRPAAQVSWWLGNERLSSNVRDSVIEDGNATISTITFLPAMEDNGKKLTCRADNLPMPHTALKDERLLNVQFAPQLRISFGANIGRDSIREGSDVYLECRVRANPPVKEVVWLHDGRSLHGSLTGDVNAQDASRSTIIMTNQSLVIQKVHRSHRGHYQCVAINDQGESVSEALHLKVNFAPVCATGQKHQYGVSRNEQIRIRCEVASEPSDGLTFRWTLNTSGAETPIEWASFTVNASTSIALYRPESSLDYGTLACVAQNSIGIQSEPCIFNVVPAGRPDSVRGCEITNHSMSTLLVECAAGDDGGLRQHFNLEVYIATTQRLHSNHSSSQPNFIVSSLTPGTQYSLVLYANNAKGRSHSTSLSAVTLSPPEKHIARGSIEQIVVHPILAILVGIVATVVLGIIAIILVFRGRHCRYRNGYDRRGNSNGDGGSHAGGTLTSNGDLKLKKVKITKESSGCAVGKSAKIGNGINNVTTNGDVVSTRQLDKHNESPAKAEAKFTAGRQLKQADTTASSIDAPNGNRFSVSGPASIEPNPMASLTPSGGDFKCDTSSVIMPGRTVSNCGGDSSQHSASSSSAATTAPMSDLIGPNGTTLFEKTESGASNGNFIPHSSMMVALKSSLSPSHQMPRKMNSTQPLNVVVGRTCIGPAGTNLADFSTPGSTCCSSSNSSSPHALIESGVAASPSIPTLHAGMMLFASELPATDEVIATSSSQNRFSSPHHYHNQQQQQQLQQHQQHQQHLQPQPYATHPYHPYLSSHASTLPRHHNVYSGATTMSCGVGESPLKLYTGDSFVHTSAIYGNEHYAPLIVNGLVEPSSSFQSHANYHHHQQQQQQQYSTITPPTSSSSMLYYHTAPISGANLGEDDEEESIHSHNNTKTPLLAGPAAQPSQSATCQSFTLPRRCSVGPIETPKNNDNESLYVAFTKASKSNANQYPSVANSGVSCFAQVDCLLDAITATSAAQTALENSPLLGGGGGGDAPNLDAQLRPQKICLTSSPRKGATAV